MEININEVNKLMSNSTDLILIDVRETDEWDGGHIPDAIHIPKASIERDIEKNAPNKDARIVLYCGGGMRSVTAANSLIKLGYTNVKSMAGGISAWARQGYEIAHD